MDKHVRVRWKEHRARSFAEERVAAKAWISDNFQPESFVKTKEPEIHVAAVLPSAATDKVIVLEALPVIEKDPYMFDEEEPEAEIQSDQSNESEDESLYPARNM